VSPGVSMATVASLLLSCFAMCHAGVCVHHGVLTLAGHLKTIIMHLLQSVLD